MLISKQELRALRAPIATVDAFIGQTGNTDKPVDISSLVVDPISTDLMIWVACKKLPRERVIRFACDCMLLNVEKLRSYSASYQLFIDFLQYPSANIAPQINKAIHDDFKLIMAADTSIAIIRNGVDTIADLIRHDDIESGIGSVVICAAFSAGVGNVQEGRRIVNSLLIAMLNEVPNVK